LPYPTSSRIPISPPQPRWNSASSHDASIVPETVRRLNEFCRARQLLQGNPAFEAVVEHTLAPLWIA
jgi:hypothetical protein